AGPPSELALIEAVFLDLHDEARARDAQLLGEPALVPVGAAETLADHGLLELLERVLELARHADALDLRVLAMVADALAAQLGRDPGLLAREDDQALDLVLELADVARPRVVEDLLHRPLGERLEGHALLLAAPREEVIDQDRDVLLAVAQRRHRQVDHVDAV